MLKIMEQLPGCSIPVAGDHTAWAAGDETMLAVILRKAVARSRARADGAELVVAVDAGGMAVIESDLDGVVADRSGRAAVTLG